jgi:hypothetical protein
MVQTHRKLKLRIVSKSSSERRIEPRTRIQPVPARLSDLYRERLSADVLNVSSSGLGIKTGEPFKVNFPVLIECCDLLIVANVRHCLRSTHGSYLLGVEVHRIIELDGRDIAKTEAILQHRLTRDIRVRGAG